MQVSSYWLVPERVVLDPMLPPDRGAEAFAQDPPRHVVLSNRHHVRDAAELMAVHGCSLHLVFEGLHELEGSNLAVQPFSFGEDLPGGLRAHGVYEEWPDEGAIEIPRVRALALADGVMHYRDALHFVPDRYLGDDPEEAKRGLRAGYARLVAELEPEHLLLAHGDPVIGGGAEALRRFAQE
jgi:hypothetical protein